MSVIDINTEYRFQRDYEVNCQDYFLSNCRYCDRFRDEECLGRGRDIERCKMADTILFRALQVKEGVI